MRRTKRLGGSGGVWRSSYIVLGATVLVVWEAREVLPDLVLFSAEAVPWLLLVIQASSAIRARTSFLTSPTGIGFASGNRTVPFDVSYPFRSRASFRRISPVIGYKLQWLVNAAYQTSGRSASLNAGIR